jgi:acyl carrier protein
MDKLAQTLADIFEDDELNAALSGEEFKALKSWDSLTHLRLVVAIQTEFALDLGEAEIRSITSVEGIRQVLATRGKAIA